jgi:uncharacterized membrane protein
VVGQALGKRKIEAMISALTSLEAVYIASGVVLLVFAGFTIADRTNPRRLWTGLFWGLFGLTFALGGVLPAWGTGVLVVLMVIIDGLGWVQHGVHQQAAPEEQARRANRFGWKIFIPVLMIPAVTYAASLMPWNEDISADRIIFVSLGYASIAAAIVAGVMTGARPLAAVHEGRRLADAIGAVVILPQLLASLGILFTTAGVGRAIANIVVAVIPSGSPFAIVFACCLIIAALTFFMGNSFAAFPVVMGGLAIPLLVQQFHVDPAAAGLILLTGASCGTLCTPMAANFNMVPAALLEMRDPYGVIKFQAPFAAAMFVVHVFLLWTLV